MIDKRKVRLMTRAAIYEKRYGEEDIKITGYYQKDYSSLNTWITLIWVTAGFFQTGKIPHIPFHSLLCPDMLLSVKRTGSDSVYDEKRQI